MSNSLEMQKRIYAYIEKYITKYNYSPTIREIQKAMGFNSTSTIKKYLDIMADNNLIAKDSKPRTIKLIKNETNVPYIMAFNDECDILNSDNIVGYLTLPYGLDPSDLVCFEILNSDLVTEETLLNDVIFVKLTDEVYDDDLILTRKSDGRLSVTRCSDDTDDNICGKIISIYRPGIGLLLYGASDGVMGFRNT